MKVVVIVRTRDEQDRIGKFCESYKDADHIIVSDGGSTDNTVSIASQYSNVILSPFTERVELQNGYWRNNDAAHVNHLIVEAKKLSPDWIILDDCDCRPNYLLRDDYRRILQETTSNFVMAVRIYLWGTEEYFPQMSKPAGTYEASLWAWRGEIDFKMVNVPPAFTFKIGDMHIKDLHFDSTVQDVMPPYCLLHYSWDEERVARKLKDYAESGLIPGYKSPLEFAGERKPLEEWMKE